MASWFEGILEINDIHDYQYDHGERFMIRTRNIDKFKYYAECLTEYIVFRYVYVDVTCNEYNKDQFMIFKNCFVTGVIRETDDNFIINFYYGEKVKGDEIMTVFRGIKLNKLRQKLKSTI